MKEGYKETAIGLIPEGWEVLSISDFADILDKKRIPLSSEVRSEMKGHFPYCGANGIVDYIDQYIFEGIHVLIAEDGGNFHEYETRPISYLMSGKFWVNNHAHVLRAKNGEHKFLHYSLVHKDITTHIIGSTRTKLNKSTLEKIPLAIPSKTEQSKIASILSTVDDKIDAINEKITQTQQLKHGLMQRLLNRGVGHTKFKDSPIGEIPDSWEVVKLDSLVTKVGSGITPKGGRETYLQKGIIFIRSQNVLKGKMNLSEIAYISSEQHEKMNGSKVMAGDVLLNITGASIGRSCVVPSSIVDGNVNQHVCIIRTKDTLDATFLCQMLNSYHGQNQIEKFQAGGNREGLNFQQIRSFEIPFPPNNRTKDNR